MAICTWCDQEMSEHISCTFTGFHRGDVVFPNSLNRSRRGCWDCGAPPKGFHHPGCDQADCPVCGRQALMCGCRFDEDGPEEDLDEDLDEVLDDLRATSNCIRHLPSEQPGVGWPPGR